MDPPLPIVLMGSFWHTDTILQIRYFFFFFFVPDKERRVAEFVGALIV